MVIKLVIFDIGGVLMMKNSNFTDNLKEVAEKYGASEEEALAAFYKNFNAYHFDKTLSQYNFWKMFLVEFDHKMTNEDFEYLFDLFNNRMQTRENGEILQIVTKLAKKGYKLAILSHSFRDMDKQIFSSNFLRYFDRICLSHLNSKKKDTREAFAEIMDSFSVEPSETFFIDDKRKNLLVPEELGLNTFLYNFEEHDSLLEKLKELEIIVD